MPQTGQGSMELTALPSANLQRCVSVRHCKVMYVDHGNFKGCRIPSYLWLLLHLIQFSSFRTHYAYPVWASSLFRAKVWSEDFSGAETTGEPSQAAMQLTCPCIAAHLSAAFLQDKVSRLGTLSDLVAMSGMSGVTEKPFSEVEVTSPTQLHQLWWPEQSSMIAARNLHAVDSLVTRKPNVQARGINAT